MRRVVRDGNGQIIVVIDFGGFFGFGSWPIAIPVEAMVLLGQDMEVVAFTPDELIPIRLNIDTCPVPVPD